MDDWNLLREYVDRGSDAAFAALVERHMKFVYWTCRRDLRDSQLAEDATQEVFLQLARRASQLNPTALISGWLFVTARNVSRNTVKTEARRKLREQEAVRMLEDAQRAPGNWEAVEVWLNAGLSRLSAFDRQTLLLRYYDERSVAEIADALGCTEAAVWARLWRATERLRRFLDRKEVHVSFGGLVDLLAENVAPKTPVPTLTSQSVATSVHSSVSAAASAHASVTLAARSLLVKKGSLVTMQTTAGKCAVVAVGIATITAAGVAAGTFTRHDAVAAPVSPTTQTVASASPTAPDKAERPITLDLRGAPIRSALVQLFESVKVDFSIDPAVQGFVTLKIMDQPFYIALPLILRASTTPLTCIREGGVYIVKTGTP